MTMSDIISFSGKTRLLPPAAKEFIKRRLAEVLGILLMAAGLAYCLAVVTFNPGDPSLNKASDEPVRNLLGKWGAIAGDFVLQSVGLAGLAIGVVLIAWGWQAVRDNWRGHTWLRLALLPLAVLIGTIYALARLAQTSQYTILRTGGLGPGRALSLGTAIILGAIVWAVWSLKSVHGGLERSGQLGGLEGWNGIIYDNPKDPRLWVPKISGYGTTLNFAHRRAWIMLGSILVLSLGAAAFGVVSALCR